MENPEILNNIFDPETGFCARNLNGSFIFQNRACVNICGVQPDKECNKVCMDFYSAIHQHVSKPGPILASKKLIRDQYVDLVFLKQKDSMITLLCPMNEKVAQTSATFNDSKLTAREKEVLGYLLRGFSNREICKKLFISRATLKTHINRIYKKLPEYSHLRCK